MDEHVYSADLDRAAQVLFPHLPADERRTRVESVIARAEERGRFDGIESIPANDLFTVLLSLAHEADDPE